MTTSLRFSGLGTALLAACGLLWLGCGGGHDERFQMVESDDCASCHLPEYVSTSQPSHAALGYRADVCASCHGSKHWRPPQSPDLHPDDAFSISTLPHGAYGCPDCHDPDLDLTSIAGINTNCVGCHTGSHTLDFMDEVHKDDPDYPTTGERSVNFCLDCHPDGRFDEDD